MSAPITLMDIMWNCGSSFFPLRTDVALLSQLSIVIGILHHDYARKSHWGHVKRDFNQEDGDNKALKDGKSYGVINSILHAHAFPSLAV